MSLENPRELALPHRHRPARLASCIQSTTLIKNAWKLFVQLNPSTDSGAGPQLRSGYPPAIFFPAPWSQSGSIQLHTNYFAHWAATGR
eukprot:363437-Chlamydomonas_euryale.AAC.9